MANKSSSERDIFRQIRLDRGLTREKASELMFTLSPSSIEKIENGSREVNPSDVLEMARAYKKPHLCNHYCSEMCAIGKVYVPKVNSKVFPQMVLEILNQLNQISIMKDRLIEIAADGIIDEDELPDFIKIQQQLEEISVTVEALQLWVEDMIASGHIDEQQYNASAGLK